MPVHIARNVSVGGGSSDRARDLAARKVISTAEFDAAQSKYAQKKAAVDNIQSTIDKKEIRAPFDGTAGIRAVNPGQMVKVGEAFYMSLGMDPSTTWGR